ncbi:MAG: ABC transporter substrate-binding protein [Rhodoluna sp.]|nr:ABC transporter substrate-binding protein [Rhodoluna sp.]
MNKNLKRGLSLAAVAATAAMLLTACAPAKFDAANCKDAKLALGSLLPTTGNLAFLGAPEIAGVDLAVKEINENGGVGGTCVSVKHTDSGDTTTNTASQSEAALKSAGVDAIVGAASSGVTLSVIDKVVKDEIVQVSPANTAPVLSTYKDNGFYFRTAPSDVLQGRVLGNKILADGYTKVGFLTIQDPYGTGLQENAAKSLTAQGGSVVANEVFPSGAKNVNAQVDKVLAAKPDAIAVISFDEVKVILPYLVKTKGWDSTALYLVDGNTADFSKDFTDFNIAGAQGTIPGVIATDAFKKRLATVNKDLTVFAYAAESYDATMLIALAASVAVQNGEDVTGATIKKYMVEVSKGGTKVDFSKGNGYKTALDLIKAGKDIDFEGVSGPISFDDNGDPTEAYVGTYIFGTDNNNQPQDAVYGKIG